MANHQPPKVPGEGGFRNPGFVANVQLIDVLFSHSKKKCGVFIQINNFLYVLFSQSKKKCGALASVKKEMWCFRFASKRNVVLSFF